MKPCFPNCFIHLFAQSGSGGIDSESTIKCSNSPGPRSSSCNDTLHQEVEQSDAISLEIVCYSAIFYLAHHSGYSFYKQAIKSKLEVCLTADKEPK